MLSEFLEYLYSRLGKSFYVRGAQGQSFANYKAAHTYADIEKNADCQEKSHDRLNELEAAGVPIEEVHAYDCSGLGMWFLQQHKGLSADRSSRGMYADCDKLTADELKVGDWVFRYSYIQLKIHHVGYVSKRENGKLYVIDCGYNGVVEKEFSTKNWNRFGRPKWFKKEIISGIYDESEEEELIVYCFQKAAVAAGYTMLKEGKQWLDIVTGENNGCDNDKGAWTLAVMHEIQGKYKLPECDDIDDKLMNAVMSEVEAADPAELQALKDQLAAERKAKLETLGVLEEIKDIAEKNL